MPSDSSTPLRVRLFEHRGTTSIVIDAEIAEGGDLAISGYDSGEAPQRVWGDSDYEYWVTVRSEHKDRVLLALVERVFGGHSSAASAFQAFLESKGIPCEFSSWT